MKEKDEQVIIKSYKGFDKNMKCGGLQYEEGKEMPELNNAVLCNTGYHACENPMDVFGYYPPAESIYHEAEQSGKITKHEEGSNEDSKIASTKIKIGAKIDIKTMVDIAFKFVWSKCDVKKSNHATGDKSASSATGDRSASSAAGYSPASSATGDKSASSATGDSSASSATGYRSASSATGYRSASSATGYRSASSATGDSSASSATGDRSASSATGYGSASSATGYRSASSATGYGSASSATGDKSASSATGDRSASLTTGSYCSAEIKNIAEITSKESVAIGIGYQNKAKAPLNCWIVLAERNDNGEILDIQTAKVDGEKILADTWYVLKDGTLTAE